MIKKDATTTDDIAWRYRDSPQDRQSKVLLLTEGRVAILGPWLTGDGIIAWCPIPKRNREIEKELGLL